ncbi:MAG: trehalase-like domain-containing protein, partial [Terriglobales bacterium]
MAAAPADAPAAQAQLPLRDYGLVADGLTSALVGRDGGVGWLCLPRPDSPSIFAPLLDPAHAGWCRWWPRHGGLGEQRYLPGSNVLVTELNTPHGRLRLTDWMPARFDGGDVPGFGSGAICRFAEALEGETELVLTCEPRPEYGRMGVRWWRGAAGVW